MGWSVLATTEERDGSCNARGWREGPGGSSRPFPSGRGAATPQFP